ncbi:Vacuolar protein sorting-associated protein 70 [Vanrija albida]|uniref:Vacuolar protein sorting-associated protein 70 n=1 Tax=Vanrija albida TaxID=181172 RepID=A0ABR3PXY9_9TREE
MVAEKREYTPLPTSDDTLPQPVATGARKRKVGALHVALFAVLGLLVIPRLVSLGSGSSAAEVEVVDPVVEAYWTGVATQGYAAAVKGKHDHDHDHKHPKHPKHPGGDHKHKWISPHRAEKLYLEVPSNNSAAAASRRYTANAHPAGTGWDLITALQVKNDWEAALGLRVSGADEHIYEAGSHESQSRIRGEGALSKLGVWIDTYYPVLNTPVSSSVTLLTDPPVHAKLREEYLPGDPDSRLRDEVPVFHGFSVSGNVQAQYIYAGYGTKYDFELLQAKGIDFTGKIALVKYGRVFRGLKVKAAQEAGAIGTLIFTDPGDDGEVTEANGYEQYPAGPARVPSSVQRGSVQFLSKYPGDPTTPGEPAYKNATRIEGGNFPDIPSLPLSYEDAIPLLKALKGKGIPAADLDPSFEGGLGYKGVEYFTGPSDAEVHLVNEVNTRVTPIWNTLAIVPGHITDEVVIVGNHRDAWVLGGADPNSGTASQYELVRGLGALIKKGWKPLRSIVLASWDAEEYGLIGSTEWAEDFGDWLQGHAAAYLNLDSSSSGQNLRASASPSLALLLRGAAQEIEKTTQPGVSVWDARVSGGDWDAFHAATTLHPSVAPATAQSVAAGGSGVNPLGSGSDYTAFLQRYGIASTDFSFSGGPKDAVYHYHSIYDSHHWVSTYGDPGFHKHTEAAKIIGLIALRLADSVILPFNTTQYARDLGYYLTKVEDLKQAAGYEALDLAPLGDAITDLAAASAGLDAEREDLLAKLRKALPEHAPRSYGQALAHAFGLAPCPHAQAAAWAKMAVWDDAAPDATPAAKPSPHGPNWKEIKKTLKAIRRVNVKLRDFESGFIAEEGIKDREWYRHKGVAPGKWLGYGSTTFPALTEAITIEKDEALAQKDANELVELIGGIARGIRA